MLGKVDWSVRTACKDCKERVIGCHIDCEKYRAFRKEKDEEAKGREKHRIIDNFPRK